MQPAIAIARGLVDRGHPAASIELVGSERGIEARLVPAAGFALTLLPGRGIERKLSVQNLRSLWGLVRALGQAWRLVGRKRPRVVVSVGGYASVPCALAAAVRRIPIVVAEQNAAPGAANRLVSRFAKACAVSFPDTPLPRAVVTGNPVRPEVLAIDRPATPWAPAPSSTSSRAAAWSSSSGGRWAPCGSTGPPSRPPACGPAAPTCTCAT